MKKTAKLSPEVRKKQSADVIKNYIDKKTGKGSKSHRLAENSLDLFGHDKKNVHCLVPKDIVKLNTKPIRDEKFPAKPFNAR